MGYAELIEIWGKLPPQQQAEVFDFAEFLAARCKAADNAPSKPPRSLRELLAHPLPLKGPAEPFNRDALYDRACLR